MIIYKGWTQSVWMAYWSQISMLQNMRALECTQRTVRGLFPNPGLNLIKLLGAYLGA